MTNLSEGFGMAGTALLGYADKVDKARRHLEAGLNAEQKLDDLVSSVATTVTRTAQLAEPMLRWEGIRSTTGVLDWIAELGMDVDKVRGGDFKDRLTSLPEGDGSWLRDVAPGGKEDWIQDNKELINAAAAKTGLPPDLITGIAWIEVGGKPYAADDVTYNARRAAESPWSPVTPEYLPRPLAGDKDETSFGPMAVQIRPRCRSAGLRPREPERTAARRDQVGAEGSRATSSSPRRTWRI